ncbi:MAG: low molecular weight protein arginine phosphatase [Anaerolineales bacterium]|nr:low molecular weight protein arginine phosphatase [Anaerolineales bacterium]MDW8162310.1 low molecular weight protein arginine phosphatase [Anaerolineales bacterium]
MKSVLFVCTANVCRSPMAQGLFLAALGENVDHWRVESAGVAAVEGAPASQKTLELLAERGIDLSSHKSRPVDRYLMEQFNLILVMEHRHKQILQSQFPQFASKVYLLSEMVGEQREIDDPGGGTMEDYRRTAQILESIFREGYSRIEQLAQA